MVISIRYRGVEENMGFRTGMDAMEKRKIPERRQ
jgi:hypothetical protein